MSDEGFLKYLWNRFLPHSHHKHWFLIGLLSAFSLMAVTYNATSLKVSVIGAFEEEELAFDGTSYPFDSTFKWSKMEYQDWKTDLDTVEEKYDLNSIQTSFFPFDETKYLDVLGKSDSDSANYWNTYLIPWSYTYEPSPNGSHPGTDIRGVRDMPIYSIANAKVIKVKDSDGTVCTEIKDVNIDGELQTVYPCYLHLDFRTVAEGDVVKRGQQIGGVGDKGFATTPHLHLQIDNEQAPWHPYWPFSSQEAGEAGLNFVEAVNAGLGFENLKKYTIDPMSFIQNNLTDGNYIANENLSTSTDNTEESTEDVSEENPETIEIEENVIEEETPTEEEEVVVEVNTSQSSELTNTNKIAYFQVKSRNYYPGLTQEIQICSYDSNDEITIRRPDNDTFIDISKGKAELSENKIYRSKFSNGCAEITLTTDQEDGEIEIFAHDILNTIKGILSINKFEFSDVDSSSEFYDAIAYAYIQGITTGYPDNTFKPDKPVSRIEAVAFILRALQWQAIQNPSFDLPDASSKEWYAGLLAKAMVEGMVNGYPDGTVRLENTVNGAEFLKMFITALAEIREGEESEEWYQRFLDYAEENNLVDEDFQISSDLDRGMVVDIIYKAKDLL